MPAVPRRPLDFSAVRPTDALHQTRLDPSSTIHDFNGTHSHSGVSISGYGNNHLLCTPPAWYSYNVAIFLSENFVAHAATIKSRPGDNITSNASMVVIALRCSEKRPMTWYYVLELFV